MICGLNVLPVLESKQVSPTLISLDVILAHTYLVLFLLKPSLITTASWAGLHHFVSDPMTSPALRRSTPTGTGWLIKDVWAKMPLSFTY
ncbi:hypothetical protein G6F47_013774 [Rhizopus delemar]|nr:hypothetical protein G6F47_013774 [Rhizopus delemar]